ncbi:5'-nucleotidase C-terminal domain-containing protein, partial [Luminiphilus sp.]|nr:5'-nucleotidase C-terminal domain-containing protein [Luminiphilus sp.]
SNGKFLGVLDFDVRDGRIRDWSYRLLPIFAELLPPDPAMSDLIAGIRAPFAERLAEPLAMTDDLLYRRGNFNGSVDQLICEALMDELNAPIALSPGFRWGTTLLPGNVITMEDLMAQVAITYPAVTLTEMTGAFLKRVLEDVADNLFHPDPYYQQGGDMVRVGGLQYSIAPLAQAGSRIDQLTLDGKPVDANKTYKVAGWASVQQAEGEPIWSVVARWLRSQGSVRGVQPNQPEVRGLQNNQGIV